MKILAISDFDSGFTASKIVPKLKKEKPDIIISHGDFCYGDKMRDILFSNWKEIKAEGKHWYDYVSKKEAKELVKKSLAQAERVLKALDSFGVPVLVVYGNHESWDYKEEDDEYYYRRMDKIVKKFKNVHSIEYSAAVVNGVNFVGYGAFKSSPEYKRWSPSAGLSAKGFALHYRTLFLRGIPNVLVTHNVPYNTKLDKINNPKSPRDGDHVGSKYVRKLITRFKPVLCISGHMHENQGIDQIRKTRIVNTGMGSNGQYAVIDTKTDSIKLRK